MEEHIIEFVRKHDFLYDKNHKHYKNILLRNQAFQKLSEQINIPDKKLKERWRTLKDHYYKELRWKSNHQAYGYLKKREWKWMKQMSFLQEAYSPTVTSMIEEQKSDEMDETEESINGLMQSVQPSVFEIDREEIENCSLDDMENMMQLPPEQNEWLREKSYIQLFFECLGKQTEEANLSPRKVAELQLEIMKTFNKIVYNS